MQRHWIEDLTGRTIRAPARYEPARIAASRLITAERRKECFDKTVGRQHRCFCCMALLVFTMEEEFTYNTDRRNATKPKVRIHEAGHVYAHSLGGPDLLWNLVPLCHGCNVRMQRQLAFEFIEREAAGAPILDTAEYKAARANFDINFAAYKIANPELFV